VLAYVGVRPAELLALRWRDVRRRTLLVPVGKTGHRTVKLLAPRLQDLREWRVVSDRSGPADVARQLRHSPS
jgi:integrase